MKYKTILFDLDGTLMNSQLGITSAVQYALSQLGIIEDREVLTPFMGPPLHESFKKYYNFDDKKIKEAVQHFLDYYKPKGLYESTVYRGIPELLAKLQKSKRKLYVVTFKPASEAEKILQFHDILKYFEGVKGPKPDLTDTDKVTMMQETLSLLPRGKNNPTVMVGDRDIDIRAAQENGIDSIGVTFGFGSHEEIQNAKPTHIANTIKGLDKYLL